MTLAFKDLGTGPRRAVALHCGLGSGRSWRGVAGALGDSLTIRAIDLPGHGASPDWDGAGDLTEAAAAGVEACIDAWPGTGPVDFIGHSYGGVVLLMLAQRRPDLVRTLTLIEPVAMKALPAKEHAAQLARMQPFGEALSRGDTQAAGRLFLDLFGGGARFDDLPEKIRDEMARRLPLILASHPVVEDDAPGLTRPERLSALDVPVLLVEGTRSLHVHPAINAGLAAHLARAERAVIEGAGHMIPDTHAEALSARLAEFLGL